MIRPAAASAAETGCSSTQQSARRLSCGVRPHRGLRRPCGATAQLRPDHGTTLRDRLVNDSQRDPLALDRPLPVPPTGRCNARDNRAGQASRQSPTVTTDTLDRHFSVWRGYRQAASHPRSPSVSAARRWPGRSSGTCLRSKFVFSWRSSPRRSPEPLPRPSGRYTCNPGPLVQTCQKGGAPSWPRGALVTLRGRWVGFCGTSGTYCSGLLSLRAAIMRCGPAESAPRRWGLAKGHRSGGGGGGVRSGRSRRRLRVWLRCPRES